MASSSNITFEHNVIRDFRDVNYVFFFVNSNGSNIRIQYNTFSNITGISDG